MYQTRVIHPSVNDSESVHLQVLFTSANIHINGRKDNQALDDILQRKVDASLVEALIEDPDNNRADERAIHGSPATGETGASDNGCGNSVKLKHDT